MNLSQENIRFLQNFFEERTGIVFTNDKQYLLESRLAPVTRKHSLKNFDELSLQLRINKPDIIKSCIDAVTTNETYFFRDIKPFDYFNTKTLPLIKKLSGSDEIKILSAACSSGQEAYTIAMIMLENKIRLDGKNFKITGIDLSSNMIERAREGIFNQFEVQRGLPISYLIKYFTRIDENYWQIKKEVRDKCEFKEDNILDPDETLGEFHCIFLRNVLIYFDIENKKHAIINTVNMLKKEGNLYLGSSETNNLLPEKLRQDTDFRSIFTKI